MLAPRLLELPQDMRPLAQEARRSHDGLGAHHARSPTDSPMPACPPDTLFLRDEAEATARMQALQEERERLKAEEFDKWTRDKREQRAGEAERRRAAEEARAKAADRQKRVAQRAFKNWCRLRKDNKYVSKVVVPAPETVEEPRPTARPQVKKVTLHPHAQTLPLLPPLPSSPSALPTLADEHPPPSPRLCALCRT